MRKVLVEGLNHLDFENQIIPTVSVDEYEARSGENDEIITFSFIVKGKAIGEDLCDWIIKGYDYINDCEVSEGELMANRFVVFVETNRRSKAPERLLEILEDLETLTGLSVEDWKVKIDGTEYEASLNVLKQNMITIPLEYREQNEDSEDDGEEEVVDIADIDDSDLNEMRNIAGLPNANVYKEKDSLLKDFIAKAGL
jgi:hypothetical protein